MLAVENSVLLSDLGFEQVDTAASVDAALILLDQNKYDVWQFRMYVKQSRRYVEKSLRTKEQALAEERAEDLYIEIRNDIKNGKSFFAISIKEGVQMYLEYRKQDIGVADVGIVEGRFNTIKSHLKHYLNFVHKDSQLHVIHPTLQHTVTASFTYINSSDLKL